MTEYNRNLTDYITKQVELEDILFKDISFKKQETRKKLKSIEFEDANIADPNKYKKGELLNEYTFQVFIF